MSDKKLEFSICEGKSSNVPVYEEKSNNKDWVYYGANNLFPDYLWDLYLRSSLQQSIVDGIANYVMGDGLQDIEMRLPMESINNDDDTLADILKQITVDYLIFGGFSLQVIFNKLGEVNEIYYIDIRDVRSNKERTKFYYCKDWKKANRDSIIEVEPWNKEFHSGSCLFYFKGHKTRGVYPVPMYNGAIKAIETQAEISNYHLRNIKNNFTPGGIVNFNNGVPSDEIKDDIERRIKDKYTGTDNAGSLIVAWNDSKDNAVTFEKLQDVNLDKKYEQLRQDVYKEIFISWKVQPQLFGFLTSEGSLFNKDQYKEAFELFNKTVISPIQDDIVRAVSKIFNVDKAFDFIPFSIYNDIKINPIE